MGDRGCQGFIFRAVALLGGDFNIVRYTSKKRNCSRTFVHMNEFSDIIEEMELINPPVEGGATVGIGDLIWKLFRE